MESQSEYPHTPEAVLSPVEFTDAVHQRIRELNDKLSADPEYEVSDDCMEELVRLVGLQYRYAHAVLTGELYEVDDETETIGTDTRIMLQDNASFHGFEVVTKDERRTVQLIFSVPDENDENWQFYVAQPEDVTEFLAYPNTTYCERSQVDIFDDFVQETENIILSKDFAGYSPDKQEKIADVAIEAIDTSLRPVYGNKDLQIGCDVYFQLSKTATGGWWKDACIDQRDLSDEDTTDIYGRYQGVVIPSMHPACDGMYLKKDDRDIYHSPCLVIDTDSAEAGYVALVPLKYVTSIEDNGTTE